MYTKRVLTPEVSATGRLLNRSGYSENHPGTRAVACNGFLPESSWLEPGKNRATFFLAFYRVLTQRSVFTFECSSQLKHNRLQAFVKNPGKPLAENCSVSRFRTGHLSMWSFICKAAVDLPQACIRIGEEKCCQAQLEWKRRLSGAGKGFI
jgi:hypothetical protein